jgi:hypothetical protein
MSPQCRERHRLMQVRIDCNTSSISGSLIHRARYTSWSQSASQSYQMLRINRFVACRECSPLDQGDPFDMGRRNGSAMRKTTEIRFSCKLWLNCCRRIIVVAIGVAFHELPKLHFSCCFVQFIVYFG